MKWHLAFNTDDRERNGIYEEGEEPCLEQQKQFLVPARTIVVFIGLKERAEENRGEKRGKKEKQPADKEKKRAKKDQEKKAKEKDGKKKSEKKASAKGPEQSGE
ncbi:hypothetical protein CL3_14710 [butyrate-producing bacterium SM4/1]|nr:hypothetical protein CL3_14710 [butyrate-producing bacterium SM4/1]